MKSPLFWTFVAILSLMGVSLIFEANAQENYLIPSWVKNNAKFWSEGQIGDSDFIKGIQYLIDQKILVVKNSNSIQDNGDFKATYQEATNPELLSLSQSFEKNRVFDLVATDLNNEFVLPYDVTISSAQCDTTNSFYDSNSKQITVCYELLNYFIKMYANGNETNDEVAKNTGGVTTFVFFHELGHALINVYHLPSTGKEEDAVDQLSTILLLNTPDSGVSAITSTEIWFLYQGLQKNNINQLTFWDEHSLDMERFYNIACLAYGKDPEKYSSFVTSGLLPSSRAVNCASEYQKAYYSWNTLLQPYLKTSIS